VGDLAEGPIEASQPSLFFRQAGVPDFFDEDRGSVVEALRHARSIATVDALLGRTYLRAEFSPVDVGPIPFEQGYELARRVRQSPNHLVNNHYIVEELREEVSKSIHLPAFRHPNRMMMLHRRLAEALGASLITQMRARELLGLSARDPLPAGVDSDP